ncbi:MAG: GGDEF domain-containing protein [Candidatus Yanofskybacteria bacterium]|nr:GGDEF domain-containing protein [Candidatus Yanofskybacteria bacterium]
MDSEIRIRELETEIDRLKKQVFYDELTQVMNRRGFEKEANPIFKNISFHQKEHERRADFHDLAIIFLDIDDFKKVNDIFGHQTGDIVLQEVAKVLVKIVRSNDIVGRWGGEELVVGLVGASLDVAGKIAERIREDIEKMEVMYSNVKVPVTASIGVAGYSNEENLNELIDKADRAMYAAKQQGKNRVVRA